MARQDHFCFDRAYLSVNEISLQLLVTALILFYIALVAAIIVITPARIAQALYDFAQTFSHESYGWILLVCFVGMYHTIPLG